MKKKLSNGLGWLKSSLENICCCIRCSREDEPTIPSDNVESSIRTILSPRSFYSLKLDLNDLENSSQPSSEENTNSEMPSGEDMYNEIMNIIEAWKKHQQTENVEICENLQGVSDRIINLLDNENISVAQQEEQMKSELEITKDIIGLSNNFD